MNNVLEFRRRPPVAPAGQATSPPAAMDPVPAPASSSKAAWVALGVVGLGLVGWELLKAQAKPVRRHARRNPRRRRRA